MNDNRSAWSWSLIFDWVADFIIAGEIPGSGLRTELPPIESSDGEEPTADALRERARQADLLPPPVAVNKPTHANKALEKEFWDLQ